MIWIRQSKDSKTYRNLEESFVKILQKKTSQKSCRVGQESQYRECSKKKWQNSLEWNKNSKNVLLDKISQLNVLQAL